jgi:hypothetical protein
MMCWSEVKPWRSLKSSTQMNLIVGFVLGVTLMLLTYLVASQQFAIGAHNGNESLISFHSAWFNPGTLLTTSCAFAESTVVIITVAQWITDKQISR